MFAHQTMFDGVWSPNIYRLSRLLFVKYILYSVFTGQFGLSEHFEDIDENVAGEQGPALQQSFLSKDS